MALVPKHTPASLLSPRCMMLNCKQCLTQLLLSPRGMQLCVWCANCKGGLFSGETFKLLIHRGLFPGCVCSAQISKPPCCKLCPLVRVGSVCLSCAMGLHGPLGKCRETLPPPPVPAPPVMRQTTKPRATLLISRRTLASLCNRSGLVALRPWSSTKPLASECHFLASFLYFCTSFAHFSSCLKTGVGKHPFFRF